ncbi:hypothetical protein Vafri_21860, partial [Volvox africanus]
STNIAPAAAPIVLLRLYSYVSTICDHIANLVGGACPQLLGSLLCDEDGADYRHLLLGCYFCGNFAPQPLLTQIKSPQLLLNSCSQDEVLYRAIDTLVRTNSDSVLRSGYRK